MVVAYFVSHLEKIYHRVYGHETMSCDVLLSMIKNLQILVLPVIMNYAL